MAGESSIGSLLGGVVGSAIAPGVGTQIGAGLGGIVGGAIESKNAGKNTPQVPMEDPAQTARLREIDATRRQISEGRDPLTLQRISDIKNIGETTKGQLGKFTGGDVGGTISAMLRAQRNTGQGINQAYTESQQRIPHFMDLAGQLGNRIEQRKLELGIYERDRAFAQQAHAQQNMQNAISGTIASLGGLGKLGGNKPSNTPISDIGGGGVNSVGQFSPALQTPGLGEAFNQGLAGNRDAIAGNTGFGGFNSMGQPEYATFNVTGGFGQQLGGGFGGMGGGNSFIYRGVPESEYTNPNF